MPKYLLTASYTSHGVKGLLEEGGSGRRAAVQKLTESVGGKLDAFYFAFGGQDRFVPVIDRVSPSAALQHIIRVTPVE
ncbi:MAG: hypothetical protein DMG04_24160 [Acidobacteria bacterium]|nr:MAG: hypothetical protein DMG04_24160 [Acidobacteriota bacterium]